MGESFMYITERLSKESARMYALRIIKENIILLELEPGSMVSENELAAKMGISRTPVREALIELSKIQIVEIFPQKGSCVSKINYDLVEEARFMRLTLEKAIVEQACEVATKEDLESLEELISLHEFYWEKAYTSKLLSLDNQFHKQLFKICNKLQTYTLMNSMATHFDRVRTMSLNVVKDSNIIKGHREIMEAIANKDAEKAKALVTNHLSSYKVDEEKIRGKYPKYFS